MELQRLKVSFFLERETGKEKLSDCWSGLLLLSVPVLAEVKTFPEDVQRRRCGFMREQLRKAKPKA